MIRRLVFWPAAPRRLLLDGANFFFFFFFKMGKQLQVSAFGTGFATQGDVLSGTNPGGEIDCMTTQSRARAALTVMESSWSSCVARATVHR